MWAVSAVLCTMMMMNILTHQSLSFALFYLFYFILSPKAIVHQVKFQSVN